MSAIKRKILFFFVFLPIPIILSIKPITNVVQGAKHIPITLPDGLSYNVSTEKFKRVFVRKNKDEAYNLKCMGTIVKENNLCLDKYSGDDFTGYNVSIVSFTDDDEHSNDAIIVSGKFVSQVTQEIIYVSTSEDEIKKVKKYLERTSRYVDLFWVFIIFFIYIDLIFSKDKEQAK